MPKLLQTCPLRRATDGDNRNQWFPATDLASLGLFFWFWPLQRYDTTVGKCNILYLRTRYRSTLGWIFWFGLIYVTKRLNLANSTTSYLTPPITELWNAPLLHCVLPLTILSFLQLNLSHSCNVQQGTSWWRQAAAVWIPAQRSILRSMTVAYLDSLQLGAAS